MSIFDSPEVVGRGTQLPVGEYVNNINWGAKISNKFGLKTNTYDLFLTHTKMWVAVAIHKLKWVKIRIYHI